MAADKIAHAYDLAKEQYGALEVDVDQALARLSRIAVSLHCGQAGRAAGVEDKPDELRADLDQALALIPGTHRLTLHSGHADTGGKRVERTTLEPAHFANWIGWAKSKGIGMDFSPAFFAHSKAGDGFTLAHPDPGVRRFWVEYGQASRRIGAAIGHALGSPCVTNVCIPDGSKHEPVDRRGPRERLAQSLDALFAEPLNPDHSRDAVEPKLSLNSDAYVVASHDFFLGYAIERGLLLCLTAGQFHPLDVISDKISAVMCWLDELLLRISCSGPWTPDRAVTLTDDLRPIAQEVVRGGYLQRTHIALDFDAPTNRVAAWTIGARAMLKALLLGLLEPFEHWQELEASGDHAARLALLEKFQALPFDAVWDRYCVDNNVPPDERWLDDIRRYEREVLSNR